MLWIPRSNDPRELTESFEDFDSTFLRGIKRLFPESVIILNQRKLMMTAINSNDGSPKNNPKVICTARLRVMNVHARTSALMNLDKKSAMNLLKQLPSSSREVLAGHMIRGYFLQQAETELREQWRFNKILSPATSIGAVSEHDDELIEEAYNQRIWSVVLHQKMQDIYEEVCKGT